MGGKKEIYQYIRFFHRALQLSESSSASTVQQNLSSYNDGWSVGWG